VEEVACLCHLIAASAHLLLLLQATPATGLASQLPVVTSRLANQQQLLLAALAASAMLLYLQMLLLLLLVQQAVGCQHCLNGG
jgi:hypothetical protein